jgi:hypothetical protein
MKVWVVLRGHKEQVCCTSYLTIQSPRTDASPTLCASHSPLWWLRGRSPFLGPLLFDSKHGHPNFPDCPITVHPRRRHFPRIARRARAVSTNTANPLSRDTIPGARLKHLSADIPPARPPPRLRVKCLHDPFLERTSDSSTSPPSFPRAALSRDCAPWRQGRQSAQPGLGSPASVVGAGRCVVELG